MTGLRANLRTFAKTTGAVAVFAWAWTVPLMPPIQAETDPLDAPLERVEFGEDDTIRGIVGQYLRDPDLWPTVLALNNIASPADLVPGIELYLPVRQVFAADDALLRSLTAIQKATAEGARIFAPREIGNAITTRDTAMVRREEGEWRQVVSYAGEATGYANQALDISVAQRDRAAEAVVSDVHGTVEGRAPAEPSWSNRSLDDILIEFERLRTLSNSTTQITFRDLSRLRLNPNSNATIQRMRSDPLTGGEVTKVSLANGDFYALLNQLTEKNAFEIEVPGIESTTNSSDFWIKNDQSGARFVNYDDSDLAIERDGQKIMLGENEGVVLAGKTAQRAQVLDSPLLLTPEVGDVIYTGLAPLSWEPFGEAAGYWLEVALDPAFNQMQISEWGIRETAFLADSLPPAKYHWRVAALDQLGLPGQWSTAQDFTLRIDNTPPYLTLLSPASGSIVTQPEVEILGASEIDAVLKLNGAPLVIGSDGSFVTTLPLTEGTNTITVQAIDPAGNTSDRSLTVVYRPTVAVEISLNNQIPRVEGALATRSEVLSLTGQTSATVDAPVAVRDASGAIVLQTRVAPDGGLSFTVPVDAAPRAYSIEILSPNGTPEGTLEFTAIRDRIAPEILLDLPPPRATGDQEMQLAGSAGDAIRLELGGTQVPLVNGRFDLSMTLAPGLNSFDLAATDAVGNISVTQFSTLLDIDPPEILNVDLGRPQGDTGPIELLVEASDESGLRQAAPFVISIDGLEVDGFLRCDTESGVCRGSLPPEAGDLELIELIIEDYAGNAAFY
ncbi:FecR domain-containing protein [Phaeobacter marinintestinus]|uniref:FecR domain-containing protein n=1 Tax=Falsiphaeobacter marinintestinus TaxID=1492905 RepID=UPI00164633FC|nr:FecR domain-containing protein [Phaeobacter marinintestinus]